MLKNGDDTKTRLNLTEIDELHEQAWDATEQNIPLATALMSKGYQLADSNDYLKGLYDNQVVKAHILRTTGKYDQIMVIMSQAMAFYQEHAVMDIWRARAAAMLGYAYSMLGDYASTLEQYMHQIEVCKVIQDDVQFALAYKDIGNLYAHKGQNKEALRYYLESLAYYQKTGIPQGLAAITNNLTLIYRQIGDLDSALRYGLESLALFESTNHLNGQSRICNNLGRIYFDLNQPSLSLHYLHRALSTSQAAENHLSETAALLSLGRTYKNLGEYDKSNEYLQQSLTMAQESRDKTHQFMSHELLAELNAEQGNWQAAYQHHQKFHAIQREVLNETSLAQFHGLEMRFETKQALAEIETQKRLREQDRQYFERLNQLKDEFLATASHDLKNPLTTISLALYPLQRHLTDARGQQYIYRIETALNQMRHMITDLLDLAKLETGRALNVQKVNLVAIIQHEVSNFEETARANQIEIIYHAPDPAYYVQIDENRIIRVLQNLLSNAIKYNQSGGTVTVALRSNNDATLTVSIQDTGIGIPENSLEAIFDRFYRVPSESHLMVEGTGLGLAIAKAIIEQHHGKIWVTSALGQGSTFAFSLPKAL